MIIAVVIVLLLIILYIGITYPPKIKNYFSTTRKPYHATSSDRWKLHNAQKPILVPTFNADANSTFTDMLEGEDQVVEHGPADTTTKKEEFIDNMEFNRNTHYKTAPTSAGSQVNQEIYAKEW